MKILSFIHRCNAWMPTKRFKNYLIRLNKKLTEKSYVSKEVDHSLSNRFILASYQLCHFRQNRFYNKINDISCTLKIGLKGDII